MFSLILAFTRRRAGAAFLLTVLAVLAYPAAPLLAHAIVLESTPKVGAALPGPDIAIAIRFNSRIDHGRSVLTLIRPDGRNEKLAAAASNAPDRIAAEAKGLVPGKYVLRWQVLAVDGHFTRGDIPFRVTGP